MRDTEFEAVVRPLSFDRFSYLLWVDGLIPKLDDHKVNTQPRIPYPLSRAPCPAFCARNPPT